MIYITCPAGIATGGPTLAHQLCRFLLDNGIDARMFYYGRRNIKKPVHCKYEHFKNPYIIKLDKETTETIVFAEANTPMVKKYKKAKKYIWWMSVDNYYLNLARSIDRVLKSLGWYNPNLDVCKKRMEKYTRNLLLDDSIKHLVQSEYANIFLQSYNVRKDRISVLSDFIEDDIVSCGLENKRKKENVVLYNPAKGYEYTKKIIDKMPNVKFVPLAGMTTEMMKEKLCTAKVYIDFGNHPGKDRIPREAAICGCLIVTGLRGSAGNDIDIAIDRKYKFEDKDSNIVAISQLIQDLLLNYDSHYDDFREYRKKIINEKVEFEREALLIFQNKSEYEIESI